MSSVLLVLSKDPYSTEIPGLVLEIGSRALEKGNDVSLYLVEDGVTAARDGEFGGRLKEAASKGISIFADDKAILARGLEGKLIDNVEIKDISILLDFIMESDRVAWW